MTRARLRSGEAARDQAESNFTPLLRRFLAAEPHGLAAIFVDREGECVDYATTLDTFETKVIGAHLQSVVAGLRPALKRLAAGEAIEVLAFGDKLDLVARRIDDEYTLIVAIRAQMTDESVREAIEFLVRKIRAHASLEPPWWDAGPEGLDVRIRAAVSWGFAPEAVVHAGTVYEVLDVLGRWEEHAGLAGGPFACFRVRLAGPKELTLAYDALTMRWSVW